METNETKTHDAQSSRANDLRREAERRLHDGGTAPVEAMAEGEVRALLHELQVHQIELQMQNEELQRARLEAEEASEKYLDLFDFAPAGYFLWDGDGRILEINLAGAALLGLERSAASQKRFGQFVAADFRGAFADFLERVLATDAKQTCEVVIQSAGTSGVWVLVEGIAAQDRREPKRLCRAAVMDITQQKRAEELAAANRALEAEMAVRRRTEELLRESEERFRTVIESSSDGILIADPQTKSFLMGNPAICRMLGYQPEEISALQVAGIHPLEDLPFVLDQFERLASQKQITSENIPLRRKDGSVFYADVTANPVTLSGKTYLAGIFRDITARKQVEEALQAANERYELVFTGAGAGIWDWDVLAHKVVYSNRWKEMRGFAADEITDAEEEWSNRVHPADAPRVIAAVQAHFAGQTPVFSEEYRVRRKDNSWIWVADRGIARRDGTGRVVRMAGSEDDITERKQAEEALARERDLLQSVLDSAGKAHLVYLDRDFNFVRVNETYAATCGYRPAEMAGKNHFALYPCVEIEAIFRQVRDTGEAVEIHDRPFEFPGQPERGVTYWDWTLIPVKDSGGQVTGLFSLFETTARVRAEAALRESEERYRMLFDRMSEGFALHEIVTDEQDRPVDYRYLDVNPAFERLTGLNRAVVLGKRVLEVLPALEAHWIERFGRVALTGEPEHFENHAAELGRWYGVFAYRPAPRQFAVVFTDITARKQAEEALQASLREKDILLHEVHHRVKNNLQVISSLISLQTDALDGPGRAAVGNIRDQVRAMALVHEQLYQAGDFGRIDFAGYAQKLLMQLWRAHGEIASTAELRMDFEPVALPLTSAVPCGLILNELAGNALKHAFKGCPSGGRVTVTLRGEAESHVFLCVADNGAGLPEGFDWRNAQSLGLRLVQMLVGQVSGTVEARSPEGGGTAFEVRFGIRNG